MKVHWKALYSGHSSSLRSFQFTDLNITFGKISMESSDPYNYRKKKRGGGGGEVSFSSVQKLALIDLIHMTDDDLSPLFLS